MTYDVSPVAMFKLKLISAMHALDYFTWPRVGVNLLGLWPRVDAQFPLLGPKSEPFCVEVSPSTHEKHKMLADHELDQVHLACRTLVMVLVPLALVSLFLSSG